MVQATTYKIHEEVWLDCAHSAVWSFVLHQPTIVPTVAFIIRGEVYAELQIPV